MPRTVIAQTRLTPTEANLLHSAAEKVGVPASEYMRRVLLAAVDTPTIDAWSRERDDHRDPSEFTPHFKLTPLSRSPTEMRVLVREWGRRPDGTDEWFGPCSMTGLSEREFVTSPSAHQLVLRGGGRWRVVGHVDVTPAHGGRPYAELELKRTSPRC